MRPNDFSKGSQAAGIVEDAQYEVTGDHAHGLCDARIRLDAVRVVQRQQEHLYL